MPNILKNTGADSRLCSKNVDGRRTKKKKVSPSVAGAPALIVLERGEVVFQPKEKVGLSFAISAAARKKPLEFYRTVSFLRPILTKTSALSPTRRDCFPFTREMIMMPPPKRPSHFSSVELKNELITKFISSIQREREREDEDEEDEGLFSPRVILF